MEEVTPSSLATLGGNEILNNVCGGTFEGTFARRWMSHFAASPTVCTIIWRKLFPVNVNIRPDEHMPRGAHPRHLLWALYFLKGYPLNNTARSTVSTTNMRVDEKTWRKWTKLFVDAISYLESEVVSLVYILFVCPIATPQTNVHYRLCGNLDIYKRLLVI